MNNEEKILQILATIETRLGGLEAGQKALLGRQEALEGRQEALEAGQKALLGRQEALEAKVDANREEAMMRFDNLDNRLARVSVDLRNFRKESADSFAGVYKCLDLTDAQVEKLQEKMA